MKTPLAWTNLSGIRSLRADDNISTAVVSAIIVGPRGPTVRVLRTSVAGAPKRVVIVDGCQNTKKQLRKHCFVCEFKPTKSYWWSTANLPGWSVAGSGGILLDGGFMVDSIVSMQHLSNCLWRSLFGRKKTCTDFYKQSTALKPRKVQSLNFVYQSHPLGTHFGSIETICYLRGYLQTFPCKQTALIASNANPDKFIIFLFFLFLFTAKICICVPRLLCPHRQTNLGKQ